MAPRVTVLMSVFNDAPFLRTAVDSILGQSFRDFEFLIVDDGSRDESRAILESYSDPRIRLLPNAENIGLTRSLNRGLSEARGELVARMDGNDISFPERLARQVEFFDRHRDVAAAGVQVQIVDVQGKRLRRAEVPRPTTDLGVMFWQMFTSPLVHPGSMFRREVVWGELGGYNETFRTGQDAELWLRVARRHRVTNLSDQLLALRFDRRSISGNPSGAVRSGHRERWLPLFHEQMRRALQSDVPREWPLTWIDLYYPADGSDREAAVRFPAIAREIHLRFTTVHPDARASQDVNRWCAFMLATAAIRSARRARLQSARTMFRAAIADPRRAPWRAAQWLAASLGRQEF